MQDVSMAGIGMQVLMMVVTTVLGWALGALREKAKATRDKSRERDEERDTYRDVFRLLLGNMLSDKHRLYVIEKNECSAAEKREVEKIYTLYHDKMGGNGAGTRMYQEIMALNVS